MLPAGLFPALGRRFVSRWHRTFLESPYGVALVAVGRTNPSAVYGFLLGSIDERAHVAAVLTDRRTVAGLALRGASALSCRPLVALRFLRTRARPWWRRLRTRRRPRPAGGNRPPTTPRVAVLAAVAVQAEARGSGLGAELTARFLEQARAAGATCAELVTLSGPTGAGRFYEHLGWRPVGERRTRDGDAVRVYRHALASPLPEPSAAEGHSS